VSPGVYRSYRHLLTRYRVISYLCRSSTLENWVREFAHFAPSIAVQTYYGGKDDRPALRQTLLETLASRSTPWEVLITTYNLATGDDKDRKFLRKIDWDVSWNA
jgi:SWI/SNF-related matrix-associated actin-dependent regulator 1 of chromatin subfamily A